MIFRLTLSLLLYFYSLHFQTLAAAAVKWTSPRCGTNRALLSYHGRSTFLSELVFVVAVTHTSLTPDNRLSLPPASLVLLQYPVQCSGSRFRQRWGWALRLCCSPQQLAWSLWWWLEAIASAPKTNTHTLISLDQDHKRNNDSSVQHAKLCIREKERKVVLQLLADFYFVFV